MLQRVPFKVVDHFLLLRFQAMFRCQRDMNDLFVFISTEVKVEWFLLWACWLPVGLETSWAIISRQNHVLEAQMHWIVLKDHLGRLNWHQRFFHSSLSLTCSFRMSNFTFVGTQALVICLIDFYLFRLDKFTTFLGLHWCVVLSSDCICRLQRSHVKDRLHSIHSSLDNQLI